jgi:hypothetical protein
MRSSHSLDRLDTAFDDDRLVADAGLLLPATLAARAGTEVPPTWRSQGAPTTGRASPGPSPVIVWTNPPLKEET